MKAYEMEVGKLFNIVSTEYRCFWIVPDHSPDAVKLIYLSEDSDITHEEKLLESALIQKDSRVVNTAVKQWYPSSPIEQFALVKNIGNLKLGFAIFIYKNDVMNTENLQEFEQLTSYYLLLGFYTKFVNGIKRRKNAI